MSLKSLFTKALGTAARSQRRSPHGPARPVRHTSPKSAAASQAVKEAGKILRKR